MFFFEWHHFKLPNCLPFTVLTRFWQERRILRTRYRFYLTGFISLIGPLHLASLTLRLFFLRSFWGCWCLIFQSIIVIRFCIHFNFIKNRYTFFTFNSSRVQTIRSGSTSIIRTLLLYIQAKRWRTTHVNTLFFKCDDVDFSFLFHITF